MVHNLNVALCAFAAISSVLGAPLSTIYPLKVVSNNAAVNSTVVAQSKSATASSNNSGKNQTAANAASKGVVGAVYCTSIYLSTLDLPLTSPIQL